MPSLVSVALLAALWSGSPQAAQTSINEELWEAARAGDIQRVTKALESGADVNAKTRYGATALAFAADKGHLPVVTLLLERGADINAQDTFYRMRAIDMALSNGHLPVATLLLQRGSLGAPAALNTSISRGDAALVKLALASQELTRTHLNSALAAAKRTGKTEFVGLISARLESMPSEAAPAVSVETSVLQSYVGTYRNEGNGVTVTVALNGNHLTATANAQQPPLNLIPTSTSSFRAAEVDGLTVTFAGRGGTTERALVTQNNTTTPYERVAAPTAASPDATAANPSTPAAAAALDPAPRGPARPWPAFRGQNAAGSADGQGTVAQWDVATGKNVRWKTPIPGISNSSPIIWGNHVFVATAVSSAGDATFRTGLYGDVKPVDDLSAHTWKMYCLDRTSGKILWERTAFAGVPKVKRHTKASQSNSTPVTDGQRVVALFGSIGLLAAWDVGGTPLWTTDIGVLDSGWFFDPAYQWGHSSSPIIYRNTVIVQADVQKNSFIAAYDLGSGRELWKTERDEISTWGTPTILTSNGRDELVTNGTRIRGYDPATGKLLWTLGPNSEVTVGTPVVGDGLVYVTAGYPPVRPIYAVRPGSQGDISLPKDAKSSNAVAWSNDREGTYIPTPIFYDGILYTLANNGILSAYDGKTGERIYRSRVGGGGSYAASPIAADGRLYLANEDGEVFVVRAGRSYQELTRNEMKEVIMSTPAASDGILVIRTLGHVYGIGLKP